MKEYNFKACPEQPARPLAGNRREIFSSLIFYLAILIFLIAFNFTDTPPPFGWYQQFMPSLGGRQISDIFFLDSLTGWAVTNATNQNTDTTYVLKTTNSGDNWLIQYRKIQTGGGYYGYTGVYFLNQTTGYTCGVPGFYKSTDGGTSWSPIWIVDTYVDMSVLSVDTQWLVSTNPFTGGVYRTTDGGASWDRQYSGSITNIYMFNGRIGFISHYGDFIRKTTNSGLNWDTIATGTSAGWTDIHFVDSLTGWRCSPFGMKKTTDGGYNWVTEVLPYGGMLHSPGMSNFSNINKDTIWGNGGYVLFPNSQTRWYLQRTTNGGINWFFQVPDTLIHVTYYYVNFINWLNGWATDQAPTEIHTVSGGDTNFLSGIKKIGSYVPNKFLLKQNYPNPFNPSTIIRFQIERLADVRLVVYDVTGKLVKELINQKQKGGEYEVTFDARGLASGVYFYSLIIDGKLIDTKKMILIK